MSDIFKVFDITSLTDVQVEQVKAAFRTAAAGSPKQLLILRDMKYIHKPTGDPMSDTEPDPFAVASEEDEAPVVEEEDDDDDAPKPAGLA